jgi:hypothetical protein
MLLMLTCQNTIDTIAHEKLMKTVAEKIADKSINEEDLLGFVQRNAY